MLWRNSLSISGQTHETWRQFVFFYDNKLSNRPFARSGHMARNTQVTQWDFKHKGTRASPARLSLVLKVSLRNLRPSVIYSVPCDRAYCPSSLVNASHTLWIHVSVRILMIKISLWTWENFCSYRSLLYGYRPLCQWRSRENFHSIDFFKILTAIR